jgi:hypothetical protein
MRMGHRRHWRRPCLLMRPCPRRNCERFAFGRSRPCCSSRRSSSSLSRAGTKESSSRRARCRLRLLPCGVRFGSRMPARSADNGPSSALTEIRPGRLPGALFADPSSVIDSCTPDVAVTIGRRFQATSGPPAGRPPLQDVFWICPHLSRHCPPFQICLARAIQDFGGLLP